MKGSHTISDFYNALAKKLESPHRPQASVLALTFNDAKRLKEHDDGQRISLGAVLRRFSSADECQLITSGERAGNLPQGLRHAASLHRLKEHVNHLLLRQALFIMVLLVILAALAFQLCTSI
ncbi:MULTISPECIES: hypothetical protein [Serratia]|uniref:Uncharacterized protein n=1 Tax=Serratia fonticola TaxID=47917 RepID=A0AAW3WXL0_SERFO|nr:MULTISPECIES: hypothetical protein [Serratia]MBC3215324.1 hypothetical protein [Serratia fonticola]NYA16332.1 hypothetical protein [Serratia fonticola]NYA36021.1 hypothetical protein [Serratia fonticola]OCJ29479.1 hypothetical protein A6U95_27870 [Serratia sp. 14-2641]